MLEPNYLQNVGDDLEKLYQELATEILVDIAERIKMNQDAMTSTTEYLNNKLKQLGLQQDWINKRLAEILHTSEEEVDRIMQQSAYKSIRDTFDRLEAGGYDTSGLEFSDQIKKGTSALWGDIQNLTRTTAQLASDTFMRYYDMAYLQVSSGAYSLDQATANTIDKLCREGLTKVSYPSGAQRSIEAAVRLAVRTAVNQNALACEKSVIDELDINLVQTSAHMGARPSHAAWQGKVFWVNYPEGNYENFYDATGYGTGAGLGGWNCRHSFTAYFPGISEDYNQLVKPYENDRIYQMEQKQRSYERKMRKWDRDRRVKAAAGLDTTKEDYWYKYNKMRLKELVDASKGRLKRDYSAEKIGGTKGRPYKPVRIPKERLTYKEDVGTKEELNNFLNKNLEVLKTKDKGKNKSYWTGYLSELNSRQSYKISQTPEKLKDHGIHDENVILKKTDLAYILYRHVTEYPADCYEKIADVINDYDYLIEGKKGEGLDFKYYKTFRGENDKLFSIEVVTEKEPGDKENYIVHMDYFGTHRTKRILKSLKNNKFVIIDSRNQ